MRGDLGDRVVVFFDSYLKCFAQGLPGYSAAVAKEIVTEEVNSSWRAG